MTDEPGPVLDQINVIVRDMEAMVAFYRRLGVRIDDPAAPWDRQHRSAETPEGLNLDLDSREFAKVWNRGRREGDAGVVIGFRVPDRETVDQTFENLTDAGYTAQQPPYDAFWGARYAVVEDPDGNAVGLMSPIDPERRTPQDPPPA